MVTWIDMKQFSEPVGRQSDEITRAGGHDGWLDLPEFDPWPRRSEPEEALRFGEAIFPLIRHSELDRKIGSTRPETELALHHLRVLPASYPAEFIDALLQHG
jgi:hypothetical protein